MLVLELASLTLWLCRARLGRIIYYYWAVVASWSACCLFLFGACTAYSTQHTIATRITAIGEIGSLKRKTSVANSQASAALRAPPHCLIARSGNLRCGHQARKAGVASMPIWAAPCQRRLRSILTAMLASRTGLTAGRSHRECIAATRRDVAAPPAKPLHHFQRPRRRPCLSIALQASTIGKLGGLHPSRLGVASMLTEAVRQH
mmetsp:Transcript_120499/g.239841  ORF Transcript_120499/g.239841 Transcript_120499/m.239841 type:complete len:204 (+) Transcript_120499:350-961(+)